MSLSWSRPKRSIQLRLSGLLFGTTSGDEHGPFDFIGDVHGCCDELEELLVNLAMSGRRVDDAGPGWSSLTYAHPEGRKAVFVGDLVDRGPRIVDSAEPRSEYGRSRAAPVRSGQPRYEAAQEATWEDVQISHGLANSLAEIDAIAEAVRGAVRQGTVSGFSTDW